MNHRVLGNLLRISRCFDNYRRQQIKDVDIYPALQLFVSYICRHPGCIQENLVEELCIDKTTVTHHLMRLEEKGYIVRKVSPEDARCRLVYPTEKSEAIAPQLHETYVTFYDTLLKGLTEEEQEQVTVLAEKLFNNAYGLMKK